MTSNEIVLKVIRALERHGIPYMLVGSYSSNAFGVARSTQDADFVIQLDQRSIAPIAQDLLPEVRLDPQLIFESVTMTSRFVARHQESGFKVELFLLSDDPYSQTRFSRRKAQPFLDATAVLPSAEDVIVQKLRWFGRARRAKDLDDARNVIHASSRIIDLDYIRHWCDQHGTRDLFEKLWLESRQFEQEHP